MASPPQQQEQQQQQHKQQQHDGGGGGGGFVLRAADAADFWPLADLHCAVFFPAHADSTWKGGLARIDRLLALQMNRSLEERRLGRAVCVMALDEAAEAAAAEADAAEGQQQQQQQQDEEQKQQAASPLLSGTAAARGAAADDAAVDAAWRGPRPLLALARWAARPEAARALGRGFEDRRLLGVAQLDSFGDVVPPKALSAARDGALGWVPRVGVCYVSNVAVAAAARRRGVARALMAEVEATAAEWGFRCVALVRARLPPAPARPLLGLPATA